MLYVFSGCRQEMTPGLPPLKQYAIAQKRRKNNTMNTNVDDGIILDSAFLTCCIVSVNGHTSSFKVDRNSKVVDAFRKFALECGFGWTDTPKNEHFIEVRIGDRGWSVTATAIDGYDLNCNGSFTATGPIPVEVLEMTGNAKSDGPKSFIHGNKVIDGNPFSDTLEFASASKARKYAKRHRHELIKTRYAWDY